MRELTQEEVSNLRANADDYARRAALLQRLRLERIDLYQFHAPDPNVPFAESGGALAEGRKAMPRRSHAASTSGTRSIDHLEDNVHAAALRLAPGDFDALR